MFGSGIGGIILPTSIMLIAAFRARIVLSPNVIKPFAIANAIPLLISFAIRGKACKEGVHISSGDSFICTLQSSNESPKLSPHPSKHAPDIPLSLFDIHESHPKLFKEVSFEVVIDPLGIKQLLDKFCEVTLQSGPGQFAQDVHAHGLLF